MNLSKDFLSQFAKYCTVSLMTLALNFIIIVLLTERVGLHYLISVAIGFFVAVLCGFAINFVWTFPKTKIHFLFGSGRSFAVAVLTLGLILITTWIFTELLNVYYLAARGIAAVLAGIFSYNLDAGWTFKIKYLF